MTITSISVVVSFLSLSLIVLVQHGYTGDYHKCLDAKGQIYFSNIACPSTTKARETQKLPEMTEREYQEAQRKEEEAKRKEKARQQAEAQAELARAKERLLNECLAEADERYQIRWDKTCLFGGAGKGCLLNSDIASGYDRSHRGERNECYKRHPQH